MPPPLLGGIAKQCNRLTPRQARFILDCLTYHFEERREAGFKRLRRGIYPKLGKKFGVSPDTIKDIWNRRTFKWLPISNIYTISLRHRSRLLGD